MTIQVSIVIPLYNKGPHISRSIKSVLDQTCPHFEIIVMDGNSTDSGPEIVKAFDDPRIRFYVQEGSGVSAARNQAVGKAQADYIAFMDADDEWTDDHLATLVKLRDSFPDAGIHSTGYTTINHFGVEKKPSYRHFPKGEWEGLLPSYFLSAALGPPPVWTSAAGVKKEIFLEAGGFNEEENFGEDLDLWARIALNHPIAFSTRCTAKYHLESVNRLCNENRIVRDEPLVNTMKRWFVEDRVPRQILPDVKEYYARTRMGTAIRYIYAGEKYEARKILSSIDTKLLKFDRMKWYLVALSPRKIHMTISRFKNNYVEIINAKLLKCRFVIFLIKF